MGGFFRKLMSLDSRSPASNDSPTLGEIQRGGLIRAIELDKNLASYRSDENTRLRAAIVAKAYGLESKDYALPFPGNTTTINKTTSPIGPLLLAAAILAAAAIGYKAYTAPPAPTPPPAPAVIHDPGFDASVDVEVIPPQPPTPAPATGVTQ